MIFRGGCPQQSFRQQRGAVHAACTRVFCLDHTYVNSGCVLSRAQVCAHTLRARMRMCRTTSVGLSSEAGMWGGDGCCPQLLVAMQIGNGHTATQNLKTSCINLQTLHHGFQRLLQYLLWLPSIDRKTHAARCTRRAHGMPLTSPLFTHSIGLLSSEHVPCGVVF